MSLTLYSLARKLNYFRELFMWSKVNTLLKLIIDLKQQTAKILALSPENNGIIFDE